jgi:hypothetical protein
MVRYDDVKASKLFEAVNKVYGSNDIELRNRASKEVESAISLILVNYPNVDFSDNFFEPLQKRPPGCHFEAYVSFKDILVGRDYELD